MLNLKNIFTFYVLDRIFPFWTNMVQKTKKPGLISLIRLKIPFLEKFGQKNENLVPRLNRI